MVDIFKIVVVRIRQAVGLGNFARIIVRYGRGDRRIADGRYLGLLQRVRNSHFVQVGIGCECQQAGVLVLPTKAPNAVRALALGNEHFHGLTADLPVRRTTLFSADLQQGLIGYRFHIAVTQSVGRRPGGGGSLDSLAASDEQPFSAVNSNSHLSLEGPLQGTNCAVVYQCAIPNYFCAMVDRDLRVLKLAVRVEVAHAQLGNLARSPADRGLVTLSTRLGVVQRA